MADYRSELGTLWFKISRLNFIDVEMIQYILYESS